MTRLDTSYTLTDSVEQGAEANGHSAGSGIPNLYCALNFTIVFIISHHYFSLPPEEFTPEACVPQV